MDYLNSREVTVLDFDSHYPLELLELEKDINKTIGLYSLLLTKKREICFNDKPEYLFLILRSVEYLISASFLVRQRAFFEAGNIIRLCIETSSVAIHIQSDMNEFKKYKLNQPNKPNKYESTKAISFAKNQIIGLGELWGSLSSMMVHPNTYHGIYSELIDEAIIGKFEINFGSKTQNEFQDKQMLLLLRISANIIFRCFEIIVTEKAQFKGTSGLYLKDFDLFMFGNSTEKLLSELMDEFKK